MNIIEKIKLKKVLEEDDSDLKRNYIFYPDYIKNNEEVIRRMVEQQGIDSIDNTAILKFFQNNPKYLELVFDKLCSSDKIDFILIEDPGLIYYITDETNLILLHARIDKIVRKMLKKQPDIINKIIEYNDRRRYYYLFKENPDLVNYVKKENANYLIETLIPTDLLITEEQFLYLDEKNKITQINRNKNHFYYGDNLNLLKNVDIEIQKNLYNENNDIFNYLSIECKMYFIKIDNKLAATLTKEEKIKILSLDDSFIEFFVEPSLVDEYLKIVIANRNISDEKEKQRQEMFNKLYSKGHISKLSKKRDYPFFKLGMQKRFENYQTLYKYILSIENHYIFKRNDNGIARDTAIDICRVLAFLNDDVLKNNSEEYLISYFKNPTSAAFKKIIINAYGESAANILQNRPNVNIDMIEEPRIFDSRIIDKLGEGFVQQLMNYKIHNINYFINTILEDDFLFENYLYVYGLIYSIMGSGIETINLSIEKFINLELVLRENKIRELILKDKRILTFIIFNEMDNTYFENKEQIDNYFNVIEKNISNYTGLNSSEIYNIVSILDVNIDTTNILTDEDIEILTIMKAYKDNNEKQEKIIELMDKYPKKFNPMRIHRIQNKVKNIYTNDFNNTMKEKNESITSKCEKSYIDSIEVIDLKGEDFCFLVSGVNGKYQSQTLSSDTKGYIPPYKVVENWLTLDNGVSTISTSLLSETCIISEGNHNYHMGSKIDINNYAYCDFFGFEKIDNYHLLGSGACDQGAMHSTRSVKQRDHIVLNETAKKIMSSLFHSKVHNDYLYPTGNETVIRRYDEEGRRLLPDFILVYDNEPEQLQRAIIMAKEFEKNGHKVKIYRINKEYYKNKYCPEDERYHQPTRKVNSELLEELNVILNTSIGSK